MGTWVSLRGSWGQGVCLVSSPHWDPIEAFMCGLEVMSPTLCVMGYLGHCAIAVKGRHDQGNLYERKRLIGGLLSVSEA